MCYILAMKLVQTPINADELASMADAGFGELVKAVVDAERGLMAIDGELHSDEEALLLANGSRRSDLARVNLYPDLPPSEWIEFDSMTNIRPAQGNRSLGVEDPEIRKRIVSVVESRASE